MWWNERSASWMCSCVTLSCQYGPKISEECFLHFAESTLWRTVPNKVSSESFFSEIKHCLFHFVRRSKICKWLFPLCGFVKIKAETLRDVKHVSCSYQLFITCYTKIWFVGQTFISLVTATSRAACCVCVTKLTQWPELGMRGRCLKEESITAPCADLESGSK